MIEQVLGEGNGSSVSGALLREPELKESAGRGLSWLMLSLLAVSVAFFAILHHYYPQVFRVPDTRGFPFSSFPEVLLKELGTVFFAGLLFIHSLRVYGFFRTTMFFMGSFIFTGLQESIWILLGRFGIVEPTYYFTKGLFWFFETPMTACLGWYYLAYSTVYVAGYLLPGRSITGRAAMAGFLAMNFDLWADPLSTHQMTSHWVWLSDEHLRIFSIPFTNFVGWFLLIFVFAILFERIPGLVKKYGPGKCTLIFFSWLIAADVLILAFIWLIRRALSFIPYTNLTWWGI
jgi:hypothetical protein